jgi:hypothetical protein
LQNDQTTGNVTGVTFDVRDSALGTSPINSLHPFPQLIPAEFQAPIIAFQLNLTGPSGDLLSSGAGTITYSASNPLTVVNQPPACQGALFPGTGEKTNACFGMLPPAPSNTITQTFGVNPAGALAHLW